MARWMRFAGLVTLFSIAESCSLQPPAMPQLGLTAAAPAASPAPVPAPAPERAPAPLGVARLAPAVERDPLPATWRGVRPV